MLHFFYEIIKFYINNIRHVVLYSFYKNKIYDFFLIYHKAIVQKKPPNFDQLHPHTPYKNPLV